MATDIRVFDETFETAYRTIRDRLFDEFGLLLPDDVNWHSVESTRSNIVDPTEEFLPVVAAIKALPTQRSIVRTAQKILLETIANARRAWHGWSVLSGFNNQNESQFASATRYYQREFEQGCGQLAHLATTPQRYHLLFSRLYHTNYPAD